jgi:hypothetical protein
MDSTTELAELLAARPHLFSAAIVPLASADLARMAELVGAVERVVAMPAYQDRVLSWAPDLARHVAPNPGAFFGYDFHLTPTGPRLIEINTNAGGALLAARQAGRLDVEDAFVAMLRAEAGGALGAVAIVDEAPEAQYLYPEFLLFKALLERHGIAVAVCAPADLMLCHGGLWVGETRLDLVYNRLTDFALAAPGNTALRQAWLDGSVVVTPHPRAHALYADKRNLVLLSDADLLDAWGVDAETRGILAAVVPRTERVLADHADDFWARRKALFFKPATGYGSKAAYRGDKITRRVFDEVLAGDYVAQALVPPSTVTVEVDREMSELKVDLRCYAYAGCVQLVAARAWQGQTTNFRTPGGGFAKVRIS